MTVACLFGDSSSTFGLVPPGDNSLVDVRTGEAQTQEGRDEVTSDLKKQIKHLVVRRLAGKQDLGSIRFGSPVSSLPKLSFMDTVS